MIKEKEISITGNSNNIKKYNKKYKNIKIGEKIMIDVHDLSKTSKYKITAICDICSSKRIISYFSYIRNYEKYKLYTCQKCSSIKNKKTNQEKYNVDYPIQKKEFKEKRIKTNQEKYGVDYYQQLDESKEKVKTTKFKKYNNKHYNNIKKIKETKKLRYNDENYNNRNKSIKTIEKLYGVINISQLNEIKNKKISTFYLNYGVSNYSKSEDYRKNKKKFLFKKYKKYNLLDIKNNTFYLKCNNCHNIYNINKYIFRNRIIYNNTLCSLCNPVDSHQSDKENQLYDFIKENYSGNIITSDRKILNGKELDIYLPDLKLAFEFNGVYWHNELYKDNNYHLNKTEDCLKKNIQLTHVWEDDWNNKEEIIKSMILNKLGKTKNKIYGRKTQIKEIIDNKLIKKFLDKNHIQGFVGSKVKIGLFYDNELVSLMNFGKKRKALNSSSKEGEYELLRFCNKSNTSVIGGASKLFNYFIRNFNPLEITTYADRSHSQGNLYEKLGFGFIHKTVSNYYYVIDGNRKHRFNYRKDKLIRDGYDCNMTEHEIMLSRNIYRIYDSGSLKYIYNRNNILFG